jgi:hypothetical protein
VFWRPTTLLKILCIMEAIDPEKDRILTYRASAE